MHFDIAFQRYTSSNDTERINIDFLNEPLVSCCTDTPKALSAGSATVDPEPKIYANKAAMKIPTPAAYSGELGLD